MVGAAEGWRLLLPPGWVTLPTQPQQAALAISRLLDRALRGKPRDELVDVRIQLDRTLREQVARAAAAGAGRVHASVDPVRGMPVSASLVSRQVRTHNPERLAPVLHAMFGEAAGIVEIGYADLADRGRCVGSGAGGRRRRQRPGDGVQHADRTGAPRAGGALRRDRDDAAPRTGAVGAVNRDRGRVPSDHW